MPKDILTQSSEWFEKALQANRFREGTTLVIRLPESPPAVEALLYFIHTLRLDYASEANMTIANMQNELQISFEVWMAGQKYLLPRLQDTAMSRICAVLYSISQLGGTIPCECLVKCFKIAEGSRPLQIIIADNVVDRLNRETLVVSSELAACDGFIAAIHESEVALHESSDYPQSFPRYKKPLIHDVVLGGELPEGYEDDMDKGITRHGTVWDRMPLCEECGKDAEADYGRCNGCSGSLSCGNCGSVETVKTLCSGCSGHRADAGF
ncbi:hypothetical protein HII31_02311 [Pseudocercospora fuligena]|uniref:BTB domain-containing protein n=1 Tax=Pseudocercospora fuligena TaxID=685502 RepID=A0A8H6VPZ3_9PEZI|nr:hypothetical protein HII31_02311 [Pseudocercospora fuligena]